MLKKANDISYRDKPFNVLNNFLKNLFRKLFNLNYKPLTLQELKKRPYTAGAEVINICNANCSFCGYGKGEKGKDADPRVKGKIDTEALYHLVDIYSKNGGGNFSLSPILGEVSAHPDWLNLVKNIKKYKNIKTTSCFTNATLLHRHGFKEILLSGLDTMTISTALGNKEQYRRLYGIDMYEQVKSNIINILKKNNELNNPVEIYLALRIDKPYKKFFSSVVYKKIKSLIKPQNISILESWDDFRGIIKQEGLPKGHIFKKLKFNEERKSIPCYALYRKLQILTDGTIQGCSCRIEPELWGGNIKNYNNLHDAWNDKQIESIRNDWFKGKLKECCKQCSHYQPYTEIFRDGYIKAHLKTFLGKFFDKKIRVGGKTGKIRIESDESNSSQF